MRKSLLTISAFATLFACSTSYAQISNGGIPASKKNGVELSVQPTSLYFENPLASDEALEQARKENETRRVMEVARFTNVDVKFPESGVFEYLENGTIVWRAQVIVPNALALGTYFDRFDVPKGVDMYLYNEKGNQIVGAFGVENISPEDKLFAVDAIYGKTINIELNIDPSVDLNQIDIHVDRLAVYYEGISHLGRYVNDDDNLTKIELDRFKLQGRGSICMIDAACKEDGVDVARRAAIQTLYASDRGLGMCSAAMINSAGNRNADCKNFIFTASHCQSNADGVGDYSNNGFSQTIFRYNFEIPECNTNLIAEVNSITGANFVARSYYSDTVSSSNLSNGDFLLLQLRTQVPRSYNSALAGWKIERSYPANQLYIGYHHPTGDIKKVSWTTTVSTNGGYISQRFPSDYRTGTAAQGSSGSALFDKDGRILGTASTASITGNDKCGQNLVSNNLNYFNIASAWEFSTEPNKQLKRWLDPFNSGVKTIGSTNTYCDDLTSVVETVSELESKVNFYPNPSNTGIINAKFDFEDKQNVSLEIFNMLGAKVGALNINNIANGKYQLNLTELANGIYMIKVSNGVESTTKKVTISK
jgi:hypothetical protein